MKPTSYWVCDKGTCLYSEDSVRRLLTHYPRCIRHGAILTWRIDSAKPRAEVRKELGLDEPRSEIAP